MQDHGFLHQALVYLAAGVIAVPLSRRLGLGGVLGYLIAGMAIGPWGLAFVSEPQAILHFAEFGVVLLLFLVGLELNPKRLWSLRRPIFGLGTTQVVTTLLAVGAVAWALGVPAHVGIIAGMGFAMSSTAIALATLQEKNLLPTPGGQASFSVLLFQDLAVIPMMLVLGLMAPGRDGHDLDWVAALRAVALIVLLVAAGRTVMRPILRFIANTRMRETFIGFSLLLVLGIAALMQAVGLSMALGAFLAGVLLADSEYRHELELDIEPFKGLLMGLFFIAVGMSVDLGLFLRSPLLVLGLAAGVVALKVVLLYPVAKLFGYYGKADALLFALGLSQVGEFAFVLFGAAGEILPRPTLDLLNAAVAASMLTTPLLMVLYERVLAPRLRAAAQPAPDVIEEQHPVIIAGFGRFGQVVVRLLNARGIRTTVVDHDPNQVELVRRFGYKAYYGDATRLDLLEAAGAARTRLLVLAVDDAEATLKIVHLVHEHFPHLQVLARAHGRTDTLELMEMGIPAVRETFASALEAAETALKMLGHTKHAAERFAAQFRRHDEDLLLRAAAHRNDMPALIALAQQARSDLERLLAEEHQRLSGDEPLGKPGK